MVKVANAKGISIIIIEDIIGTYVLNLFVIKNFIKTLFNAQNAGASSA